MSPEQPPPPEEKPEHLCFVSCDIIDHTLGSDLKTQHDRVKRLNAVVGEVLAEVSPAPIWSSGGDGGHVAFAVPTGLQSAIDLLSRLQTWADRENVPLRVGAHYGPVTRFTGADGRDQLVGDGINLSADVMGASSPTTIVVSQAFKTLVQEHPIAGLRFGKPIPFYIKQRAPDTIYTLSINGVGTLQMRGPRADELLAKAQRELAAADAKQWDPYPGRVPKLDEGERQMLIWNVVYHAKRVLQLHSKNRDALDALSAIAEREDLPSIFDAWHAPSFHKLVCTAELFERRHGEFLCRHGEEGNTMFVVLRGQLGVILPDNPEGSTKDIRIEPGQIAGELAADLHGPRTASLQAVGDVAALALDDEKLKNLLRQDKIRRKFEDLLNRRRADFVCHRARYLGAGSPDFKMSNDAADVSVSSNAEVYSSEPIGPAAGESAAHSLVEGGMDRTLFGPLARYPIRTRVERLRHHLAKIDVPGGTRISPDTSQFERPGIYLLAAGKLQLEPRMPGGPNDINQQLDRDRDRLPIVYADFGEQLIYMHRRYRSTKAGATLIRIDLDLLDELDGSDRYEPRAQQVRAVEDSLAKQFDFDVFLSHNRREDLPIATQWKQQLEARGLNVYLDEPAGGVHFPRVIETAILHSKVFVPILSAHLKPRSTTKKSWVEAETEFRLAMFDARPKIVPIDLGADSELLPGITPIPAETPDERNQVPDRLAAVVDGLPSSRSRVNLDRKLE